MKVVQLSEAEARELVEDVCALYGNEVRKASKPIDPWMFALDYVKNMFAVFNTKEVDDAEEGK